MHGDADDSLYTLHANILLSASITAAPSVIGAVSRHYQSVILPAFTSLHVIIKSVHAASEN